MNRYDYDDLPVLLVDDPATRARHATAAAVESIVSALDAIGLPLLRTRGAEDAALTIRTHPELACVLVECGPTNLASARAVVASVRARHDHLPVFVLTEDMSVTDLPPDVLGAVQGIIWATEDTPSFTAGRIARAVHQYLETLYPPFFDALVRYVDTCRYAWHTPGHMGGLAFRKSPAGRRFFDFFGERVFRADLSAAVPELGSILEHEGVVAEAEAEAAHVFGADHTWFVTNGTTMSNQVVFRANVRAGDVVVLDRNCHKSVVNAVIQVGAIPVWLLPERNSLGMIGPIRPSELSPEAIARKIREHPLVDTSAQPRIRMAVVTNSTYDGTMYDTHTVLDRLREVVPIVHFDEAWIPYAAFHPVYARHFAMAPRDANPDDATVFSTMSTHKMLASFSQGSMIHVRVGRHPVDEHRFNEAFMMHASTSPQYEIVASLDVATRMMEGTAGRALMGDCLEEAIAFRQELQRAADLFNGKDQWFFSVWQPKSLWFDPEDHTETLRETRLEEAPTHELAMLQRPWRMSPGQEWHGFEGLVEDYAMLDPSKVSIVTPGIGPDGAPAPFGVPAGLVAAFLRDRDVVVEKTGFYTILVLFSIAVTRGKASTLLADLIDFKRRYDANAPLDEALPSLAAAYPGRYAGVGVADLAQEMHGFLSRSDTARMQEEIAQRLPTPVLTPSEAFGKLVDGDVELVPLDKLDGRIAATMCALYPPGIPVIVPGERFDERVRSLVDYLTVFERWAERFPGFEHEMQGVIGTAQANGITRYAVYCVAE